MTELQLVVLCREDIPGYPITACIVGTHHRGHGKTVESALTDLFTCAGAYEAARALETGITRAAVDPGASKRGRKGATRDA